MNGLIDAAFSRSRVVVMALVMILTVGAYAYVTIPKESSPEIPIPQLYVSTTLDGISPEDSERLLVEPLETELSAITGLKQITSNAGEGFASIQLEFEPGFDADQALDKVREGVDRAKSDLPDDANDPVVTEINTALFPILTAILSGPVPERTLNTISENLRDEIEGLPGVLEVDVGGARTELMEVLIDPTVFETYNISFEELIGQINRNNRLIAAGAIENGAGRIVLKVPGLIEDIEDVMSLPIKVRGDTVVTFADVATPGCSATGVVAPGWSASGIPAPMARWPSPYRWPTRQSRHRATTSVISKRTEFAITTSSSPQRERPPRASTARPCSVPTPSSRMRCRRRYSFWAWTAACP